MTAILDKVLDVRDVRYLDMGFAVTILALLGIGLVMVASSSLDFASERYSDPWFFVKRQGFFLLLGLLGGLVISAVPMNIWNRYSGLLLVFTLFLLILVLIPGVGKEVNGSRRWLTIGPMSVQASEMAKFCLILFYSSYLARKNNEVREKWSGFLKMLMILGGVTVLLLLEPDFGSSVVMVATVGAMMFIAGVPIFRFLLLTLIGITGLASMAVLSPYRWERLLAFMDPWSRQFDSGYQLVQSLIAFGRGEWFGLGLGNSIQKLFFLPEAHTDFIFSIFAEEFGLVGALVLIGLYGFFIFKIFCLSKLAEYRGNLFNSYVAFGIGINLALQVFINMGVAAGLLPTKGLTLPFLSYGGSSLIITCALIALIFRISLEQKWFG